MEESWKHFTATGKVTDYLKYKERELLLNASADNCYWDGMNSNKREKQEVKPDGNKPSGDRAGGKYHANRGI